MFIDDDAIVYKLERLGISVNRKRCLSSKPSSHMARVACLSYKWPYNDDAPHRLPDIISQNTTSPKASRAMCRIEQVEPKTDAPITLPCPSNGPFPMHVSQCMALYNVQERTNKGERWSRDFPQTLVSSTKAHVLLRCKCSRLGECMMFIIPLYAGSVISSS